MSSSSKKGEEQERKKFVLCRKQFADRDFHSVTAWKAKEDIPHSPKLLSPKGLGSYPLPERTVIK